MKTSPEFNHRMHQIYPGSHTASLRAWAKPATKRKMARLRIKCGCCDEQVDVYHVKNVLEINGVIGTVENWREVLLPLLQAVPPASEKARAKKTAPSPTKPAASPRKK